MKFSICKAQSTMEQSSHIEPQAFCSCHNPCSVFTFDIVLGISNAVVNYSHRLFYNWHLRHATLIIFLLAPYGWHSSRSVRKTSGSSTFLLTRCHRIAQCQRISDRRSPAPISMDSHLTMRSRQSSMLWIGSKCLGTNQIKSHLEPNVFAQ